MNKRIWIFNHYAGPPSITSGVRHYNFGKYLQRAGYSVTVFCSSAQHNRDLNMITDGSSYRIDSAEGVPFVYIRTRGYTGNGKDRVLNMLDYYRGLFRVTEEFNPPDYILASSVHPLACVAGIKIAKKHGIPCICEIRDLWPESLVEYSSHGANHPAFVALRAMEKWIYRRADRIIFLKEGDRDYIQERKWENVVDAGKVFYINNGVDLDAFARDAREHRIADADLSSPSIFTLAYTGSMRQVNHIMALVEAAQVLARRGNERIKILLWGDGEDRDAVQAQIAREGLTNIVYKGKVAKNQVPFILTHADANVLHWRQTPIMRFGVSANKLFEYFAAGRPIVSTLNMRYDPVLRFAAGIAAASPAPEDIADAMERMAACTPQDYQRYCDNARTAAQAFDFRVLTDRLIQIIEAIEPKASARRPPCNS